MGHGNVYEVIVYLLIHPFGYGILQDCIDLKLHIWLQAYIFQCYNSLL